VLVEIAATRTAEEPAALQADMYYAFVGSGANAFETTTQSRSHRNRGKMKNRRWLKVVATMVGVVLLLAGMGVALAHYLLESSFTSKYITLAIAATLLVAGFALLDWGAEVSRRWGGK
jgi:hypothetical protein